MLQEIADIIEKIPNESETDQEKYGNALAGMLAIQNVAGKLEKEKQMLAAEVNTLEARKQSLAQGYSDQLEYRNTLLSYEHELPKESARETAMEQEAKMLQRLAQGRQSLF